MRHDEHFPVADTSTPYVHGYSSREFERLLDQAALLRELLDVGTPLPHHSTVLELGCGTGAQTMALARSNPTAKIVAIDRSMPSIVSARLNALLSGISNVNFGQANVATLPFAEAQFDHLFASFFLEHLESPLDALKAALQVMKRAGCISLFEGDHGTLVIYPEKPAASRVVACQAELQRRAGGDPEIGRRLHSLLTSAGFHEVRVTPRVLYIDGTQPQLAERAGRVFVAMIEGVRESAISARLIDRRAFDRGVVDLQRAIQEGVFLYTFFKATARKRQ